MSNENVKRLEERIQTAEQLHLSSPEVDGAKAIYEQAKQELQLVAY